MRLTDQEIEKHANHKYPMELYGPETRRVIKEMKFARDFYEDQKCETCTLRFADKTCSWLDEKVVDDFKCGYWEKIKK